MSTAILNFFAKIRKNPKNRAAALYFFIPPAHTRASCGRDGGTLPCNIIPNGSFQIKVPQRGLTRLSEDSDLSAAACTRAREIASVFSHTRPDGSSCFTVSEKAYGENIAKGYGTVDKVMAAWISSEGHRANILRASYGSIGVCCLQIDGVYYWVQLFGK